MTGAVQPSGVPEATAVDATLADAVARARAGDLGMFERLVAPRVRELHRIARAILGDATAADDAVRATLVAAWRELPRLDAPARLDDWMLRILVSECRMDLERRPVASGPDAQPSADPAAPSPPARPAAPPPGESADELSREDLLRLLDGAFETLDGVDRAVVVLHDLAGRPTATIAAALHLEVATVRWRLHEAHGVLRGSLGEPA